MMNRQQKNILDQRTKDPKVSYELFTLTYGAFIAQVFKDYENIDEVNKQLDTIGYNIGTRLIEDFLSRTQITQRCNDMKELADTLASKAFKMYLGIQPLVSNWNASNDEFSLIFDSSLLNEFVELPLNNINNSNETGDSTNNNFNYLQIICGAIRGALEMIQLKVDCYLKADQLKGDASTEIRIKFIEKLLDAVPIGED